MVLDNHRAIIIIDPVVDFVGVEINMEFLN
jgi:hypothetical protein